MSDETLTHPMGRDQSGTGSPAATSISYALLGNPNTGKTTLFNRLCGVRARTGNYPGITVDARFGRASRRETDLDLADLPGVYGLDLQLPEALLCRQVLSGEVVKGTPPEAVVVVVDALNLARNLVLVGEVLGTGKPTIIALNMSDLARARGVEVDAELLGAELGCPVVALSARTGEGIDALLDAMVSPPPAPSVSPPTSELATWARTIAERVTREPDPSRSSGASHTDRWDTLLTHPGSGLAVFAIVMTGLFTTIFSLASTPMDLIEGVFESLGIMVSGWLPAGEVRGLMVDGIIGGVAGTVVFVPQIFLLFFLISLLEDTGYLARAAFVADRVLRRFGLPGHAFVPLLSSHACAIPGIMCARLIPERRDRIATILVAPFMSCSARLPVYVVLIGLLFGDRAWLAGLAFTGCYVLGLVAALLSAFLARKTLLRGPTRPMFLELPSYKLPSLRTAFLTSVERSWLFLRKAGTVILGICIVMWWLSTYPISEAPPASVALRSQADAVSATAPDQAQSLRSEADQVEARHALAHSFAGRIGKTVEPVFAPVGYDWQISIAVMTSFLAREVFVSTLAVVVGTDEEPERVIDMIQGAQRSDGAPLFPPATAASLLVFYVLAMQCLPTLAVTRRETGGWKWALLQLAYMSVVAYVAALVTRFSVIALGWS